MIEPRIVGNDILLPISNEMRWTLMESLCLALSEDDDVALMMLQIAGAVKSGQRATYTLMKLEAKAGITHSAIKLSPVEGRILADDLDYITPSVKEAQA